VGFLRYLFGGLRRHVAVSEDTVRRLDRLGYATDADLRFWRELWQQSESMFWGILRKTEEAAEEYRRWFPQLQAFAAECRRAVPAPNVGNLRAVEREQYRILLAKMEAFAGCVDRECAPGAEAEPSGDLLDHMHWASRGAGGVRRNRSGDPPGGRTQALVHRGVPP
jgi:hypothetical protein